MTAFPEHVTQIEQNRIVAANVATIHPFSEDPEASIPKVDAEPLAEPSAVPTPLAAPSESNERTLEDLASQIQEAHLKVSRACKAAVAFAIRAGKLLLEAQPRVPDGAWKRWVESQCSFSVRRAQEYMRVARAVKDGRIDARHAESVREMLLRLREESQNGGGWSEARHAAPPRKTPSTLPKKGGAREEAQQAAAAKPSADPAEPVPDLLIWDESRQRFISLTKQVGDGAIADADPTSQSHFRQLVQETITTLSIYTDRLEDERR